MIQILGLDEAEDQLTMAFCMQWYLWVLLKEDGHAFRWVLQFDIEGQI